MWESKRPPIPISCTPLGRGAIILPPWERSSRLRAFGAPLFKLERFRGAPSNSATAPSSGAQESANARGWRAVASNPSAAAVRRKRWAQCCQFYGNVPTSRGFGSSLGEKGHLSTSGEIFCVHVEQATRRRDRSLPPTISSLYLLSFYITTHFNFSLKGRYLFHMNVHRTKLSLLRLTLVV